MTAVVLRGDARCLPLPDASVDLVVTSPPYFGLRSYTDGGVHFESQIGSEATPAEWLAAMTECVAEMARVLKPSGSIFLNVGDKYAGGGGPRALPGSGTHRGQSDSGTPPGSRFTERSQSKSLLGLPWRLALACTDQLGLILRRDIIWSKPNGLPESVTDRCRSSHEYVFHLTKSPRYYAAVDEIRETHRSLDGDSGWAGQLRRGAFGSVHSDDDGHNTSSKRGSGPAAMGMNPLGKLPGSVWSIPSQPLTVPAHLGTDHFAAFPMELPRRCILGWSPPGICTACGEGRRPVVVAERIGDGQIWNSNGRGPVGIQVQRRHEERTSRNHLGYTCACAFPRETGEVNPEDVENPRAPTRPAVVVDPFCGTGTTMLVASMLGRIGIGIDRSADYCRLATWRCSDPGERARAMQVPKPPPVPAGQVSLFDLDATGG